MAPTTGKPRSEGSRLVRFPPLFYRLLFLWILIAVPFPVDASLYQFSATSTNTTAFPSFTLLFDDVDGNMLFSLDEMRGTPTFIGLDTAFYQVTAIFQTPMTGSGSPLTDWYTLPSYTPTEEQKYYWGLETSNAGNAYVWRVDGSPLFIESLALVPLPPTALLLAGGLIGLAGTHLRKRRKG